MIRDISDRKQAEEASILEERNRRAREIHDTLAQSFTSIIVHLDATSQRLPSDPHAAQSHLKTGRVLACSGLADARRSVEALRPQLLEEGDLYSALDRFAAQIFSHTSVQVVCELIGEPQALAIEVEANLLRIGQEALTNAFKYANASAIRIELRYEQSQCVLQIKDNGQGFESSSLSVGRGFGLLGMTERAERIGAELSIQSHPGQGTDIIVGTDIMMRPSPSTPISSPIRVLLSDDHPFMREGLAAVLDYKPDMTVVGQACNGHEAVALFRQHQPDITLMDLRMPELSGVEAIATICAEFADARIIVLTTYDSDEDIYRGLRAGAKGYVLKDAEPDELLIAIRAVHNGQQYIPAAVGAKLAERLGNPELSDRELEVLRLMATGKSNLEISTALSIAEGAVKFHVKNILSKLAVGDRTQAMIVALKRGIITL